MNQTKQLQGESQYYKIWFEGKNYFNIKRYKTVLNFNEKMNYNPMEHCKYD